MINHGRTLLVNLRGEGYLDLPGEEYIPPEFSPLALPGYLRALRRYFFGERPDRFFLAYRVRQLLAMLHATELAEFLTELDPRITYDVDNPDLLDDGLYQLAGSPWVEMVGDPGAPDLSGRGLHRWRLERLDATRVRLRHTTEPVRESILVSGLTQGISALLPLLGTEASFRFREELPIGEPVALRLYLRPRYGLGAILASLDGGGQAPLLTLFGVDEATASREPMKTFYALWRRHPFLPYRLGGLTLAMIYRTEAIRAHG